MNEIYSCDRSQFSSYLAAPLARYVEYRVNVHGCAPGSFIRPLRLFDAYCCGHPESHLSIKSDLVLGYMDNLNVKHNTLRGYISSIRIFSEYLVLVEGVDPAEIYIPAKIVKRKDQMYQPYIFTKDEIVLLLKAADHYEPGQHNQMTDNLPNCMRCIMAMLYCTGMRVGEVSYLLDSEVDLDNGIIHINRAKNGNHRIVTMSPSLIDTCRKYKELAGRHHSSGLYFFDTGANLNSGRVLQKTVYKYFRRYLKLAGIEHKGRGVGPRLHDLRATFAVHSLQRLTEKSADVNACLYYLQVYMGHASLRETQDYLWLTGDSFKPILERLENCTSFVQAIFEEKECDPDYE